MPDSWRLAIGTLTALRVPPPRAVGRSTAGRAMVLAPLAVVPLGLLVALVGWGGVELGVTPLAVGFVAVGALALGSRALHLDGLSDVADGLTSSYDPERSLTVMKGGTAGPAGAAALVVVLGVQAAGLGSLFTTTRGAVVAGVLVCASRVALTLTCRAGVPAARTDGLAVGYAGTVPLYAVVGCWLAATAVVVGALAWNDQPWWQGLLVVAVGLVVGAAVTWRCVQRFGGVTGDVFGAAIELTLAAMLLSAA